MAKLEEIIDIIEKIAPLETQEEWDNSGWQVKFGKNETKKIMLCVSVTFETIRQAKIQNCDLIISHHPLYIEEMDDFAKRIIKMSKINKIRIYCCHTNFDKAANGTSQAFAKFLGYKKYENLKNYGVKIKFQKEKYLDDLILELKIKMNLAHLKVVNYEQFRPIKNLVLIAGAGASEIPNLKNIDVLITGDVKYHNAIECEDFCVIDVGHFESEKPSLNVIKSLLEDKVEVIEANEKKVWQIL